MSTDVLTNKRGSDKVKRMVQIGMLSAIAVVLMLFEIPLPFAPPFYKIDFSEIPVMIGGFAMGPMAAVVIEFVKIVLNLIINGTMTAGIGELANFLIGVALVLPAALIYKKKKTRKAAALGMGIGTLFMTLVGSMLNAFVLLPTYAKAFSMPLEGLVEMGTAINKSITNLFTFVAFAVAPFNLLKGILVSIIVFFMYKKVSSLLKG